MIWTHQQILLREILTYEPLHHKSGTVHQGEMWKLIAETLNTLDTPKFTVNHRSVRENYSLWKRTLRTQIWKKKSFWSSSWRTFKYRESTRRNHSQIWRKLFKGNVKTPKPSRRNVKQQWKLDNDVWRPIQTLQKGMSKGESSKSSKRRRRSGDNTINDLRDKMDRQPKELELQIA